MQLQAYLRQVLLLLQGRAPVPLMQFLGLHEQPYLGFFSMEQVAKMCAVNLNAVLSCEILANKIIFVQSKPKVFYKLALRYKPHYPLPGHQSSAPLEEEVLTLKQFADFRTLDQVVRLSAFSLDNGSFLPTLPAKRHDGSGNKKTGDELQRELSEYLRALLSLPKVRRMVNVRLFFGVNLFDGADVDFDRELDPAMTSLESSRQSV